MILVKTKREVEGQGEEGGREGVYIKIHTLDVPELFEGIRGIGDELSEKDLESIGKEKKIVLLESAE